jgi:hypothetical protein
MRRAVYVPMPPPVKDALYRLAGQELRDPRQQARLLVEEALRRRGVLPAEPAVGGAEDDPPFEAGK